MLGVRLCSTWEAVADKKITNLTAISLFHLQHSSASTAWQRVP